MHGLIVSMLLVAAAVGCASCQDRGPGGTTSAPAASPSAKELLIPTLGDCLARVPRSPDFQDLTGFEAATGELRVAWQLTEKPREPDRSGAPRSSIAVRLRIEAKDNVRTTTLGDHPGHPYARELSVCRDAPPGNGPCSTRERSAPVQGVVSELNVQDWLVYVHQHTVRWMLVRTPSSVLLLTTTERNGLHEADRSLCAPNVWRRLLEIPIAPTVTVREEVLMGDPPAKIDCVRLDSADGRCTF